MWLAFGRNQVERLRFYTFDHGNWANAKESERHFMAKYLVDREMLIGRTKDDLSCLPGNASRVGVGLMLYSLGLSTT